MRNPALRAQPAGVLALALAATLLAPGCGSGTESPADAYRADPAAMQRGKSLFVGTCAGYCHTVNVERAAPNLFDCTWRNGGSDADIFAAIANGVPGTAMVAYRDTLPEGEADVWRLVAYIGASGPNC